jgi:hypothetical protein
MSNIKNINPKHWGPHTWFFLESIMLSYPDVPSNDYKKSMETFLKLLTNILPCEKCRYNYKDHLEKFPLNNKILSNKNDMMDWLTQIHNEVNKISGKKILKSSDVIDYHKNKIKKYNNSFIIFTIILVLIVFIIILFKYNYEIRMKIVTLFEFLYHMKQKIFLNT